MTLIKSLRMCSGTELCFALERRRSLVVLFILDIDGAPLHQKAIRRCAFAVLLFEGLLDVLPLLALVVLNQTSSYTTGEYDLTQSQRVSTPRLMVRSNRNAPTVAVSRTVEKRRPTAR